MSVYIYQIYCIFPAITETYVGSTSNFKNRKQQHKSAINNPQYKVHEFINQNGGWSNWRMEILEELPLENHNDRIDMERYWIQYLGSSLNCAIPGRSQQQWIEDNLESHRQQKKVWYKKNIQSIKVQQKNYRQENIAMIRQKHNEKIECPCGTSYCRSNKMRHFHTKKHKSLIVF